MKNKFFLIIFFMSYTQQTMYATPQAVPDFLILGVTKCGTTSLYDYLTKHPSIKSAIDINGKRKRKELHFFNHTNTYRKGIKFYNQHFPPKENGYITGEATPGYFFQDGCLKRIAKHCPDTKFIVIFRNPVSRAISLYFMLHEIFSEQRTFDQAVLATDARSYKRYIDAGCYIKHIQRWLSRFPKKQFLFLVLEDFAQSPEDEVNKVFKFLGLNEYTLPSYAVKNSRKYDTSAISPDIIDQLYKFYEPYNKELEKFLGRSLPWKKKA